MKINIPPDKLKKCCELIDKKYGYSWSSEYDRLQYKTSLLYYTGDISKHSESVYYRDFLQLVIEAINKGYETGELDYYITQSTNYIGLWGRVKNDPYATSQSLNTYIIDESSTEAKEQAIIWCMDNMGV